MKKLPLLVSTFALLTLPAFAQDATTATGTFIDTEGAEIGTVTLTQGEGNVTITGELNGVPAGDHGFHFHAVGDCDASGAFESAGDHFNPTDHQHGLENPQGPHAGDLPNVTADRNSNVKVDLQSDLISLEEGNPAFVFDDDGTAMVLHADPDDQMTDPSGNSGDRIACAVIEAGPAQ